MSGFFEPKFISLAIFIAAYLSFIIFSHTRALTAIIGALLLIATGTISPKKAFWVIDWNVTGFISAFVENVATVLIVAPIALSLAKKLNINPTKMIFSIAMSSNLQCTATLIGDPPSMLLGGFAKMNFGDFFF